MIRKHNVTEHKLPSIKGFLVYDKMIRNGFKRLNTNGSYNLKSAKSTILWNVKYGILTQPKHFVYTGLKYHLDMGIAHLKRALSNTEPILVKIGRHEYNIPKLGVTFEYDYYDWCNIVNSSFILRDKKGQQQLVNFPIWQPTKVVEQFHFAFAQYLAAIISEKTADRKVAFSKLAAETQSDIGIFHTLEGRKATTVEGRGKRMKRLFFPVAQLYEYIFERNDVQFNTLLKTYLLDKKSWIKERELEDSSDYWVDWRLLACCAFAYDRGINITVASEYIPQFVYEGNFPKELIDLSPWATENNS